MLRIGELATLAGTTVRTVRHYHAEGLLAEPARDASGYRRYGAGDLIQLLRIRRLRELGVGVSAARGSTPADLRAQLESLERDLDEQQRQLDERRRRIAELRRSLDPELPPEIAGYFAEVAAAGIDPQLLAREKETVLLMLAVAPDLAGQVARGYARLAQDPARLAAAIELTRQVEAMGNGAADPADVARLVRDVSAMNAELFGDLLADGGGDHEANAGVVFHDHLRSYPAGQRRLVKLVMEYTAAGPADTGRAASPADGGPDSVLP